METKEIEQVKKIKVDITIFQEQFNALVVNGEQGILNAQSIQKQAKALKGLAKAATELEWKTKKTAYEESRNETDKLKKEYQAIRDIRNVLMNSCKAIFDGAGQKIEDFRAECVRKAEEERRAKEEAEKKAKEAAEVKKKVEDMEKKETIESDGVCQKCSGAGKIKMLGSHGVPDEIIPCPACNAQSTTQQNTPTEPGPSAAIDTTAIDTPQPTQKPDEEKNGAVMEKTDFEVYNIMAFLGAIIRGDKGATTNLILTNGDEIMKLAEKNNTGVNQNIVSGVRLIPFDHGDSVT